MICIVTQQCLPWKKSKQTVKQSPEYKKFSTADVDIWTCTFAKLSPDSNALATLRGTTKKKEFCGEKTIIGSGGVSANPQKSGHLLRGVGGLGGSYWSNPSYKFLLKVW